MDGSVKALDAVSPDTFGYAEAIHLSEKSPFRGYVPGEMLLDDAN